MSSRPSSRSATNAPRSAAATRKRRFIRGQNDSHSYAFGSDIPTIPSTASSGGRRPLTVSNQRSDLPGASPSTPGSSRSPAPTSPGRTGLVHLAARLRRVPSSATRVRYRLPNRPRLCSVPRTPRKLDGVLPRRRRSLRGRVVHRHGQVPLPAGRRPASSSLVCTGRLSPWSTDPSSTSLVPARFVDPSTS